MANSALTQSPPTGLKRLTDQSDILLAGAVVAIVAMMIIPLPEFLLDVMITINIAMALTILLVSMYTQEPLQFSVFPSLLLIATLFRLGLNISASRLILLHAHAGAVIDSFGKFVVGGNYVVGVVVFLILIVIQFVVITNGAGRVAEVAARFTLDAMPGKQMSIDADLNAGLINEDDARRRRRVIEQEADFYGAMDGASKFVKGDAIAGIVIILINIFGGFVIGVVQLGIPMLQALQTYTLLTVGDGLVSQIPALLISTATGIIVTRAASESNLGHDVVRQMLANPRALAIVAVLLTGFGLVPGLPKFPFFTIAALIGAASYLMRGKAAEETKAVTAPKTTKDELGDPENVAKLLQLDPMELEIGYGLIPLVDVEQGGNLLSRIGLIRRQVALDLGIVLPTIRIRDNVQLNPNAYVIKMRGAQIAQGEVRVSRYLAMNPGLAREPLDGIPTTEPAFGLPAVWIVPELREQAELLGYTIVDPSSVVTTHLTEVIKANAPAILGRQDTQSLLDNLKPDYPALVDELIPALLTVGDVQKVLQNLLKERISARDLVTILETLANYARYTKDTDMLTEYVRQALSRTITNQYAERDGTLKVITLSPELQQIFANALQRTDHGVAMTLEPSVAQRAMQATAQEMERIASMGFQPIVLCPASIRSSFRKLTERSLPSLIVLSYSEVAPQVEVQAKGMIELGE